MTPTIAQVAAALRAGETSSVSLVEAALDRIASPGSEGERVFTCVYAEQARVAARASDMLRGAGLARSPIAGLPISIKDLFDVAGETTLAASVVQRGAPAATRSAVIVERLLAAGAILIGRTNMTEFAYSGLGINPHYGTPKNPWDRQSGAGRIPGGSSSGAAVSVADGMAIAAIGSDTGGSVRIPAALCGLVGFKPTKRRVPTLGAFPLSRTLDSVGPIANSVACCAQLDAILAGDGVLPDPATLRGLRLALPKTVVLDGLDEEVGAAFEAVLARLSAAGAQIDEVAIPAFTRFAEINAKGGLLGAEAYAQHRALIERAADRFDPRVLSRLLRGKEISAADYIDALEARSCWINEVEAAIAAYDAFLMPTVAAVAPPIAEVAASDQAYFRANAQILRNPALVNFLDGCALSIPAHAPGSAPVGLTVAGPALKDRRILAIGLAVEAVLASRHGAASQAIISR